MSKGENIFVPLPRISSHEYEHDTPARVTNHPFEEWPCLASVWRIAPYTTIPRGGRPIFGLRYHPIRCPPWHFVWTTRVCVEMSERGDYPPWRQPRFFAAVSIYHCPFFSPCLHYQPCLSLMRPIIRPAMSCRSGMWNPLRFRSAACFSDAMPEVTRRKYSSRSCLPCP